MNDIDDYSNHKGIFNDLHSEIFYYLYPIFFFDRGDTQGLPITNYTWLYFDMVQNDSGMKLKNDQILGSFKNNNASSYFKNHTDDLNPSVKSKLRESFSSLPFSSFLCPT